MLVSVVLTDVDPQIVAAWRAAFGENPEVHIVEGPLAKQQVSAWIVAELDEDTERFLGAETSNKVREEIAGLSAGHAVCVKSRLSIPSFVVATSLDTSDEMSPPVRVCMALAAGLQAVHFQNSSAPGSIVSAVISGIGKGLVTPDVAADVMWTAYDLFRSAQLPHFGSVQQAVLELLAGVDPSAPHAYKKSFRLAMQAFDDEATLPDSAAAQAQLKRRLEQGKKKTPDDDGHIER
jgi:hypothetical protein